jgi:hypothetical protein
MSLNKSVSDFRFAFGLMVAALSAPAIAALPFDVRAPDFGSTAQVADTVSTTCADYNNKVSTTGVAAPGMVSRPGACGFSTFAILMDGQPVTQYWQLVLSGANPPPFKTVVRPMYPGNCALATNIRIELGAVVRPTVLNWPKAAAIGGACAAELGRHSSVDISGIYARGLTAIHYIGQLLNAALLNRNSFEVCYSNEHPAPSKAPATLQLAAAIASKVQLVLASHQVASLEAHFNQETLSTNSCLLRCNQCGSGWAGTITNNEQIIDVGGGDFIHNELDTYYVGGTQTVNGNVTLVPTDWTATGGGTNVMGGKKWTLNAAASGLCLGSNQHPCVMITSDAATGIRSFTEQNVQLIINGGYTLTQGSSVIHSPVYENQFNPPPVNVVGQVADSFAVGQAIYAPASANNCSLPPLDSGTLKCTQTWNWQLFLQQ